MVSNIRVLICIPVGLWSVNWFVCWSVLADLRFLHKVRRLACKCQAALENLLYYNDGQ